MTLPYSNATSGEKALGEIQKLLRAFGCKQFGSMIDDEAGELLVQFNYRGQRVQVKASYQGYAAAYLKEKPYTARKQCTRMEWERKALDIASVAVYSILRDWIKGQITAIETGILSFEGAFLGQVLLPSGKTVIEEVRDQNLLPSPEQPA